MFSVAFLLLSFAFLFARSDSVVYYNMELVGVWTTPDSTPFMYDFFFAFTNSPLAVIGDRAYIVCTHGWPHYIYAVDISDPTSPVLDTIWYARGTSICTDGEYLVTIGDTPGDDMTFGAESLTNPMMATSKNYCPEKNEPMQLSLIHETHYLLSSYKVFRSLYITHI